MGFRVWGAGSIVSGLVITLPCGHRETTDQAMALGCKNDACVTGPYSVIQFVVFT